MAIEQPTAVRVVAIDDEAEPSKGFDALCAVDEPSQERMQVVHMVERVPLAKNSEGR